LPVDVNAVIVWNGKTAVALIQRVDVHTLDQPFSPALVQWWKAVESALVGG